MTHWLFVRGLSREQRHWHPFPKRFESELPNSRVHLLDLAGAGTEWQRPCPLTLREITRDLRDRWLSLRADHDGPWNLLGISLGGMVTLQWLADNPRDFQRAVVINTSAGDLSPPWHRMDLGVLPSVLSALRERDPVARERTILETTTKVFADHEPLARTWAGYHGERPITRANALRQLAAATRFRSPARIEAPLLVLCAARDPLARPGCGLRIAEKYGARHELHATGGHDLPRDDPRWVIERVADFVTAS